MKTFFWKYLDTGKVDKAGNRQHYIEVWRVVNNEPRVAVPLTEVGYRTPIQAVKEELARVGELKCEKRGSFYLDANYARYFQL